MLNRFDQEMDNTINDRVEVDHGTVKTVVTVNEYKPNLYRVVVSREDKADEDKIEFNQTELFFDEDQFLELFNSIDDIRRKISIRRSHAFVEKIRLDIEAAADKQDNMFDSDNDHVDLNTPNLFRDICDSDTIKDKCRNSKDYCRRFYATLCNNGITKGEYSTGYSWRSTGALVADIIGYGDYLDWYCSGGEGNVDEEVFEDLKEIGWTVDAEYYDDLRDKLAEERKQLKLDDGENNA